MILDRLLNLPRHPLVASVARRLGVDDRRAADLYWRVLSPFVPSTRTITVDGSSYTFEISHLPEHYLFEHFDESALLADLAHELEPGDVFWDVGANVGVFSVVAAGCGADVYAFEPLERNVEQLRANLSRNGVAATVDRRALWDTLEEVDFTLSSDLPGAQGSEIAGDASGAGAEITVEAIPGDAVAYPRPDVVKIDVEGAEAAVLDGFHDTLAAGACQVVYCEVHADRLDEQGEGVEAIETRLSTHGYDIRPVGTQFDHRKRWKATLTG